MLKLGLMMCLLAMPIGCGEDGSIGAGGMGGSGNGETTCEAFCGVAAGCDLPNSGAGCVSNCDADIQGAFAFANGCGQALETRYQCVNQLSCADFLAWVQEEPADSFPCRAEEVAIDAPCGN